MKPFILALLCLGLVGCAPAKFEVAKEGEIEKVEYDSSGSGWDYSEVTRVYFKDGSVKILSGQQEIPSKKVKIYHCVDNCVTEFWKIEAVK